MEKEGINLNMANDTKRIERLEEEMKRQAEKLSQLQQENERLKVQKEEIPTVSFSAGQIQIT